MVVKLERRVLVAGDGSWGGTLPKTEYLNIGGDVSFARSMAKRVAIPRLGRYHIGRQGRCQPTDLPKAGCQHEGRSTVWSCTFPTPPGTGTWKLRVVSGSGSGGGGVNYPTQPNPELVRIAKPVHKLVTIAKPVHNCAALLSTELSRDAAQK